MSSDKTMRLLARYFNGVADAYAHRLAPWAYPGGRSLMVRVWSKAYALFGSESALHVVMGYVTRRGIKPARK